VQATHIIALASLLLTVGCSTYPSKIPGSATIAAKPSYIATIHITAAKKGERGMQCESDMGPAGESKCGPDESLSAISWKFLEHRNGTDFYRFDWTLAKNDQPVNTKSLSVGFDGENDSKVIDAEHYIVIRKGPLAANDVAELESQRSTLKP
jgi:hypothetical protein